MGDQYQSHTVTERHIRNRQDMQEIEEAIIRQLGGEGHRCAFLRSRAYIKLRVAALYQTHSSRASHTAFCGRLSVTMVPVEGGSPLVSVLWLDRVSDGFEEEGCLKRPRGWEEDI